MMRRTIDDVEALYKRAKDAGSAEENQSNGKLKLLAASTLIIECIFAVLSKRSIVMRVSKSIYWSLHIQYISSIYIGR
jgi:hypothetical protein